MAFREDLSVQEALQIVISDISVLEEETVSLLDSLERVLARPIVAPIDLPPFANSSMDGYALRSEDIAGASSASPITLNVIGDIAAGTSQEMVIKPGSAARIMTGAALPDGADAVVPVEHTNEPWRDPERPLPPVISILRGVEKGAYVRHPGEDVSSGSIELESGKLIRSQEIGLLASLGLSRVAVIRRPKVAILATGDELVDIDMPIAAGQIHNSNSYALAAQVLALNGNPIMLGIASDNERSLIKSLQQGLDAEVDLFISSAGVSVGAYDFVKGILEEHGSVRFWRVRMRPGKPLTFGTFHRVPFLGLPGNPVSALVSFERFGRPAILKMAGHKNLERPVVEVTVNEQIESDGRESYLRAIVHKRAGDYIAQITGLQGSHIQTSLTKANALVIVPEGVREIMPNSRLKALMIDWPNSVF